MDAEKALNITRDSYKTLAQCYVGYCGSSLGLRTFIWDASMYIIMENEGIEWGEAYTLFEELVEAIAPETSEYDITQLDLSEYIRIGKIACEDYPEHRPLLMHGIELLEKELRGFEDVD